jgi:hypothetical protein
VSLHGDTITDTQISWPDKQQIDPLNRGDSLDAIDRFRTFDLQREKGFLISLLYIFKWICQRVVGVGPRTVETSGSVGRKSRPARSSGLPAGRRNLSKFGSDLCWTGDGLLLYREIRG